MNIENNREIITDLIKRYVNSLKSGDIRNTLFTSDVTLFTPFMEAPAVGKDAVIETLKEISKGVDDIKILRLVIDAEFACALIEFKRKNGVTVDMCDSYRISDGMFAEIRPYFDPRPLMG